jgi:hypothetical protein
MTGSQKGRQTWCDKMHHSQSSEMIVVPGPKELEELSALEAPLSLVDNEGVCWCAECWSAVG